MFFGVYHYLDDNTQLLLKGHNLSIKFGIDYVHNVGNRPVRIHIRIRISIRIRKYIRNM